MFASHVTTRVLDARGGDGFNLPQGVGYRARDAVYVDNQAFFYADTRRRRFGESFYDPGFINLSA
jgi:hypothetical protein